MRFLCISIIISVLLGSCKQSNSSSASIQSAEVGNTAMPADFMAFYQKFHQDSVFQMAHIHWPLSGEKSVEETNQGLPSQPFEYLPADWRLQHLVDFAQGDFIQQLQNVGEVMVIEKIRTSVGNFGLERRFARTTDGSWELIYYSDMHELKTE